MFHTNQAFSGFSVNNLAAAREFYENVLGMQVGEIPQGLSLTIDKGAQVFVYEKPDHQPATFTILNFPVDDITQATKELAAKGVKFEHYENEYIKTDENGVAWAGEEAGPHMAWFADPAGNILGVMQLS